MNKEIKENLHFVEVFNKVKAESIKADHPSAETIYLYATRALSDESLTALANHVENCWQCGEILSDAEKFRQISADVDAGILSANVKMPSYASRKEKLGIPPDPDQARRKPIDSSAEEFVYVPHFRQGRTGGTSLKPPSLVSDQLVKWLSGLAPKPGFVGASTGVADGTTPVFWEHDGVERESDLTWTQDDDGIEVYTTDEALVGRTLILKLGGAVLNGEFEWNPAEGYCASAFLLVKDAAIFRDIHVIEDRSLEIR